MGLHTYLPTPQECLNNKRDCNFVCDLAAQFNPECVPPTLAQPRPNPNPNPDSTSKLRQVLDMLSTLQRLTCSRLRHCLNCLNCSIPVLTLPVKHEDFF